LSNIPRIQENSKNITEGFSETSSRKQIIILIICAQEQWTPIKPELAG